MSRRTTAYLYMLLVSMIWGAAPAIIKFTLADFPPLIFLTYRFFISSLIAFAWISITKQKLPRTSAQWQSVLWYSIVGLPIALTLLFFGFEKTTALAGNIITALGPLAVVLAAQFFLHERVTKMEKRGIGIAFAGTLLIVLSPLLNGGVHNIIGMLEGNLLVLAAIAADAMAVILAKISQRKGVKAAMLAQLSFIIAFCILLPITFLIHGSTITLITILTAPLSAHLGVWFMALISGTIAYSLRNRAVQAIEVSETAPFAYLFPLWGTPLAVFWLKESVSPLYLIGGLIIAVGVIIAERKKRKKVL